MIPLNRQESARLVDDLDRGVPLPAAWYTDPSVAALERDRVFRPSWQYVGRADQLARVGDCVTGDAGGVPVVVVRGEEGLRGLVNVCRHRRHLVVRQPGNRKALTCPYHAWCYDLDGRLRSAPRASEEPGFDPTGLSLAPVRVDSWGPFVFVNADSDAPPLARYLGGVPGLLARNGLDLGQLQFRDREEWRAGANWKVLVENYLECYHCPAAHPGFCSVVDVSPASYVQEPFEWSFAQYAPAPGRGRAAGPPTTPGAPWGWPSIISSGPTSRSASTPGT